MSQLYPERKSKGFMVFGISNESVDGQRKFLLRGRYDRRASHTPWRVPGLFRDRACPGGFSDRSPGMVVACTGAPPSLARKWKQLSTHFSKKVLRSPFFGMVSRPSNPNRIVGHSSVESSRRPAAKKRLFLRAAPGEALPAITGKPPIGRGEIPLGWAWPGKAFQVPADRVLEGIGTSKMTIAIANAAHTDPAAVSAAQTQPVAQPASLSPKAVQPQPASKTSVPTDTVRISTAAQTALQEAVETPVQTAKEAQRGDRQAQRLLAKEVATRKA